MLEGCTLANTGISQVPFLIAAVALISLAAGIFLIRKRYVRSGAIFVFFVVLAISFMSTGSSAFAQSTSSCNQESSSTTPVSSLQLVNDTYQGVLGEDMEFSIVANDLFPNGDAINWATLDLNPDTPEIDSNITLYNDLGYECGSVFHDLDTNPEVVIVYASSSGCTDPNSSDTSPPSASLVFRYTARSQSGMLAPNPATVTVTFSGVYASDHSMQINFNNTNSDSANLTDGASSVDDSIDPTSVDLDPTTPGQQTNIIVQSSADPTIDVTLTVDNTGTVTATASSDGNTSCTSGSLTDPIPYTIKNMAGALSNQALIYISYTNNCG